MASMVKVVTAEMRQNWQNAPMTNPWRYRSQTVKTDINITWIPNSFHVIRLPNAVSSARQKATKYAAAPNAARKLFRSECAKAVIELVKNCVVGSSRRRE